MSDAFIECRRKRRSVSDKICSTLLCIDPTLDHLNDIHLVDLERNLRTHRYQAVRMMMKCRSPDQLHPLGSQLVPVASRTVSCDSII